MKQIISIYNIFPELERNMEDTITANHYHINEQYLADSFELGINGCK